MGLETTLGYIDYSDIISGNIDYTHPEYDRIWKNLFGGVIGRLERVSL